MHAMQFMQVMPVMQDLKTMQNMQVRQDRKNIQDMQGIPKAMFCRLLVVEQHRIATTGHRYKAGKLEAAKIAGVQVCKVACNL